MCRYLHRAFLALPFFLRLSQFGGLDIADAASWTWDFFENNDVVITEPAGIDAFVAETGWPTNSMTAENLTYEGATAGVSELQTFLDTYPCEST